MTANGVVGFVAGAAVGTSDTAAKHNTLCRRRRLPRVSVVDDGGARVSELESALAAVRMESKRLKKAMEHLQTVEKELEKATAVLKGKDESSSSSSDCEEKKKKKEKKKMEKKLRKAKLTEMQNRRVAQLGKIEVEVCGGKACTRNGSQMTMQNLTDIADGNPRLSVSSCSCLGMCKGPAPAIRLNGCKVKEVPEAIERRVKDELQRMVEDANGMDEPVGVNAPAIGADDEDSRRDFLKSDEHPPRVVITGGESAEKVVARLMSGL